jgi:hypothetical protein
MGKKKPLHFSDRLVDSWLVYCTLFFWSILLSPLLFLQYPFEQVVDKVGSAIILSILAWSALLFRFLFGPLIEFVVDKIYNKYNYTAYKNNPKYRKTRLRIMT